MHAPQTSDVTRARGRIGAALPPTPLVRLDHDGPAEIWLKLENLQPIGSFKVRGSGNALLSADPTTLAQGAYTVLARISANNEAVGLCERDEVASLRRSYNESPNGHLRIGRDSIADWNVCVC